MQQQLDTLRALAARAPHRQTQTAIPRVFVVQGPVPEQDLAAVYEPMVNMVLQGAKTLAVGGQTLHYDPATYFVMSVELPAAGTLLPAADGAPYLAVALTLDAAALAELLCSLPRPAGLAREGRAFSVAAVTPELLDAWVRMLRLLDHPDEIAALAPAYEREILVRVLQGPMGWMLRDIATPGTTLARIHRAIQRVRRHYAHPLAVEDLADEAAMSVSAFHRRFKAATNFSPLQYQKQLRLLQARRLMVAQGRSVTAAAAEVGYQSATQFSREYARVFGLPPAKDVARIAGDLGMRGRGGLR